MGSHCGSVEVGDCGYGGGGLRCCGCCGGVEVVAEESVAELASCAVHCTLSHEAENGVHRSVLCYAAYRVLRVDVDGSGLCHAHLLHVGGVAEGCLDVLHIAAAAGKHDAADELVSIFSRNEVAYVLDDFECTGFDDVNELHTLDASCAVDVDNLVGVDGCGVGVSRTVLCLERLCLGLFEL